VIPIALLVIALLVFIVSVLVFIVSGRRMRWSERLCDAVDVILRGAVGLR
jgi:hypothetical protein